MSKRLISEKAVNAYAARILKYRCRSLKDMTYKGYKAQVEYSEDNQCFIGHIVGIRACVGFHSDSPAGIRKAFIEAVDDYIETSVT